MAGVEVQPAAWGVVVDFHVDGDTASRLEAVVETFLDGRGSTVSPRTCGRLVDKALPFRPVAAACSQACPFTVTCYIKLPYITPETICR